jgi:hypothetical protein
VDAAGMEETTLLRFVTVVSDVVPIGNNTLPNTPTSCRGGRYMYRLDPIIGVLGELSLGLAVDTGINSTNTTAITTINGATDRGGGDDDDDTRTSILFFVDTTATATDIIRQSMFLFHFVFVFSSTQERFGVVT